MAQVNLTVNGRVYRMACEDGEEEHVTQLGERLDGAVDELRGALGEIGDQRLMVMAGILMTDRLDDVERRLNRAEQELREMRERNRDALARLEAADRDYAAKLDAAAARLRSIAVRLQGPDATDNGSR